MTNSVMNKLLMKMIRSTLLQHGMFWIVSYYILLNIFSLSSAYQKIDFIYTAIFMASLAVPVFLNLYLLIPFLLRRGSYLYYTVGFVTMMFLFTWFNQVLFGSLIDLILPSYFFISYYSYWDLMKFFLVFMGITTMLQLSKEWFGLNTARQQLLLLEKEKSDAELKALSNQLNPHFLFNSLNVIYSLAEGNKKGSADAILKLSDILRYVIYDSAGDRVSLQQEIALIGNYIDLQRYRVGKQARITFSKDVPEGDFQVAPMLMLPLVENGFKHGLKGDVAGTFMDITVGVTNNELQFCVENNKGRGIDEGKSSSAGVGIENIRTRLKLIYPTSHEFNISDTDGVFRVELIIRDLH